MTAKEFLERCEKPLNNSAKNKTPVFVEIEKDEELTKIFHNHFSYFRINGFNLNKMSVMEIIGLIAMHMSTYEQRKEE